MLLRTYTVVLGLAALLGGLVVFGESPAASPGPISEAHEDLALDCRSCHQPFAAPEAACLACHDANHDVDPQANVHARADVDCGSCHREHRADLVALVDVAGETCLGCHGEVGAVGAHGLDTKRVVRPAHGQDPARSGPVALAEFSHAEHFEELDDTVCTQCHYVGVREDVASRETQWLWGCDACHDSWEDAGFPEAEDGSMASFSLPRFERLRFEHSEVHLEAERCEGCHVAMEEAQGIASWTASEPAPQLQTLSCFECHEPVGEVPCFGPDGGDCLGDASACSREVGFTEAASAGGRSCVACHESHGSPEACDLADDPDYEPLPESAGVWARFGGLVVTPWLALFLGLGGAGFTLAWRRLPSLGEEANLVNPDAAPQRVPEVPKLSPNYETSISGLYIIGELAGIPLVNRAMKSGFDVVDFIADSLAHEPAPEDGEWLDLVIAGSGPAGLGAATRAEHLGLRYVVCEKSTPAATILGFPRAKIVQAAPIEIPDYGTFFQEDDESKEGLLSRWEDIIRRTGISLREREEVVEVTRDGDGFAVRVRSGEIHRARKVVLAIGMRGTPRKLGIPGEDADHVAYSLIDASEHREKAILVIGGGDASVEAALSLSDPELANRVALSFRKPSLSKITMANSQALDAAAAEGRVALLPSSAPVEIREAAVVVKVGEDELEVEADAVFIMAGAVLPTGFLKSLGIKLVRKGGL